MSVGFRPTPASRCSQERTFKGTQRRSPTSTLAFKGTAGRERTGSWIPPRLTTSKPDHRFASWLTQEAANVVPTARASDDPYIVARNKRQDVSTYAGHSDRRS